MPSLLWLNVSDNLLTAFDYSEIPAGLLWLDVHKNAIENLTDHFGVNAQLRLQTLDASFNHIREIGPMSVPHSIELLFLNDNLIFAVDAHTFKQKSNLTRVDLYANQISSMDVKALRLAPVPDYRALPEFYIGGNPFVCDCNIEWLQKINQVGFRFTCQRAREKERVCVNSFVFRASCCRPHEMIIVSPREHGSASADAAGGNRATPIALHNAFGQTFSGRTDWVLVKCSMSLFFQFAWCFGALVFSFVCVYAYTMHKTTATRRCEAIPHSQPIFLVVRNVN